MIQQHPGVEGSSEEMTLGWEVEPREDAVDRRREREVCVSFDETGEQRRPGPVDHQRAGFERVS